MGIGCLVCNHPEREAIEAAILKGDTYVAISTRVNINKAILAYHARKHLDIYRPSGRTSKCLVCEHPEKDAIDQYILSGASYMQASRKFAMSAHVLNVHAFAHLGIERGRPRCNTCEHEHVDAINARLRAGETIASVAARYHVGDHMISGHRMRCLGMRVLSKDRPCVGCQHPDRSALDRAIVSGQPYRSISLRFGIHRDSISRHYNFHIKPLLKVGQETLRKMQHEATAKHAEFRPRGVPLLPKPGSSTDDLLAKIRLDKDAEVLAAEQLVRERSKVVAATLDAFQEAQHEHSKAEMILARVHRERNELIVRIADMQRAESA